MLLEQFLPMVAIALASAWTPGPNNALLAASGAAFGLRRTVPHIIGIAIGFPFMVLVVGLFLGRAFQASPLLQQSLRWGGAALLLWMGWKIATSGGPKGASASAKPFTFTQSAA